MSWLWWVIIVCLVLIVGIIGSYIWFWYMIIKDMERMGEC